MKEKPVSGGWAPLLGSVNLLTPEDLGKNAFLDIFISAKLAGIFPVGNLQHDSMPFNWYPASSWFLLCQTREKPLPATVCFSIEHAWFITPHVIHLMSISFVN